MAVGRAEIEGLDQARQDVGSVTVEGELIQEPIAGVHLRRAPTHADERGTLSEIFDVRWGFTEDPLVYVYHVTIRPEQVRGWVVHRTQNDRLFAYAGVLKIVLYDGRTESDTFGRVNVLHLGEHDRALLSIPAGVYHGVRNVGDREAAFVNLPSVPYQHDDPDKYRLPIDNDIIPYRL
ncbi:MAG: dTDP-4-dehydrorhamnose 3,5-epimerase family protein [Thermoleophilia bacterium]|nr:dTDP-4-dehydrorhamnose 3,5-epimerase family protein [Thermoleophilia bacterium]MDH4340307.1 dTDP-4-dehydrorhamnose 3,5-epimerase family protein [Thermoleophilia bacterium]MDH5281352.1 dTDP-4-dehydrorhamnose 3,5-epimerase family protein [Thermoleophilia bacterium]